jgi:hypothetical protein
MCADVCIGEMARKNHGIHKKYNDSVNSIYKAYIDIIEKDMITACYDINENQCILVRDLNLDCTEYQISSGHYFDEFVNLEEPLIAFCKLHNVHVDFQHKYGFLTLTVDMLSPFHVTYS